MPSTGRRAWTRDKHGRPVDWSAPPYTQGGVVTFLLEGEAARDVSDAEHRKRLAEYYRIRLRAVTERRKRNSPRFPKVTHKQNST